MYFSLIPDIEYDSKPISYPFSESDFIIAKNFFRRYKIDDDVFGYATFYNKYAVGDGERIENIADAYYGSPFYDWVIILTNNFINPQFAFPVNSETVRKISEEKYDLSVGFKPKKFMVKPSKNEKSSKKKKKKKRKKLMMNGR